MQPGLQSTFPNKYIHQTHDAAKINVSGQSGRVNVYADAEHATYDALQTKNVDLDASDVMQALGAAVNLARQHVRLCVAQVQVAIIGELSSVPAKVILARLWLKSPSKMKLCRVPPKTLVDLTVEREVLQYTEQRHPHRTLARVIVEGEALRSTGQSHLVKTLAELTVEREVLHYTGQRHPDLTLAKVTVQGQVLRSTGQNRLVKTLAELTVEREVLHYTGQRHPDMKDTVQGQALRSTGQSHLVKTLADLTKDEQIACSTSGRSGPLETLRETHTHVGVTWYRSRRSRTRDANRHVGCATSSKLHE